MLAACAILLCTTVAPGSVATGETFDWVLLAIDVPPGTTHIRLGLFMYGNSDADHIPIAQAMAMPGSSWPAHSYAWDDVQSGQYDGVHVGASVRGISENASFGLDRSTTTYGAGVVVMFTEEQTAVEHTFYYLVIAPGIGATLPFGTDTESNWGELPYTATWGSGSRAVRMSDLTSGFGVGAGPASTGQGSAAISFPEGIVGSHTWECLGSCAASWHGPDGRSGTWTQGGIWGLTYSHGMFETSLFSGPAGDWRWDWAGSQQGDSIAIVAPVGDAWQFFSST